MSQRVQLKFGKTLIFLFQILENKQIQNGEINILKSSSEADRSVYKSNTFISLAMYCSNEIPLYSVKELHSICQQIWKTLQWQDWKRSVFIPIPKKGNAKECSSYCTITLIPLASKVMLKILQAKLQQYVNQERPDVQAEFRKGRGTRDQIANIHWVIKKSRELQKTSASLTLLKPLTVWIRTNYGKFLKRWEYQTTLPAS